MLGGTYTTKEQEIAIIRQNLVDDNIDPNNGCIFTPGDQNLKEYDVLLTTPNNYHYKIEVKTGSTYRWNKYHDYGIDAFSAFHFKGHSSSEHWKGICKPGTFQKFLQVIDVSHATKGSIYTSKADFWVFGIIDDSDKIIKTACFSVQDLQQPSFISFLENDCAFAINNKRIDNSQYDCWESACFFVHGTQMSKELHWRH